MVSVSNYPGQCKEPSDKAAYVLKINKWKKSEGRKDKQRTCRNMMMNPTIEPFE
jgi:hypothetical protein